MNTQLLESEVISFEKNNSLHMSERTYQWLMNAVSLPEANINERNYYDYEQNELFVIYDDDSALLDSQSGPSQNEGYTPVILTELANKLLKISKQKNVIEIPRMPLAARKAIQMEFIAEIENFKFFDVFSSGIREQGLVSTFILDELLTSTKGAFYFIDYWAEYKTKQLLYFINEIEDNHNISLQKASIWKRPESKRTLSIDEQSSMKKNSRDTKKPWWKLF